MQVIFAEMVKNRCELTQNEKELEKLESELFSREQQLRAMIKQTPLQKENVKNCKLIVEQLKQNFSI